MVFKFNVFTNNFDIVSENQSGNLITEGACDVGITVDDIVYVDGSGIFQKADASDISTAKAVGLVTSKPTTTTCIITISGLISSLTGLISGTIYFLSETPGQIQNTKPAAGSVIVPIGQSLAADKLIVNFSNIFTKTLA